MNKRVLSLLLLSSVCTSLSAAHRDRRHGRKGLKQMEDPTRQIVKVAQDLASTSIQNSDGKNLRQAIVTLKGVGQSLPERCLGLAIQYYNSKFPDSVGVLEIVMNQTSVERLEETMHHYEKLVRQEKKDKVLLNALVRHIAQRAPKE